MLELLELLVHAEELLEGRGRQLHAKHDGVDGEQGLQGEQGPRQGTWTGSDQQSSRNTPTDYNTLTLAELRQLAQITLQLTWEDPDALCTEPDRLQASITLHPRTSIRQLKNTLRISCL